MGFPGGGAGAGDGGGAGLELHGLLFVTSAPTLTSHPDGTTLGSWMSPEGFGQIYVDDMENPLPGGSVLLGGLRDASAAFVSGPPDGAAEAAIVVSTQSFPTVAVQPWPPDPADLALPEGLSLRNQASATQEIVMEVILKGEGGGWFRDTKEFHFVSENPSDPGPKAVAGDLNTGEALVAWVRYETPDFLVEDGLVTIYEKTKPSEICGVPLSCEWCPTQVENFRPQMEKTAIYARNATINGPIGQRMKLSPPGDSINIEPTIDFSPSSGLVAYCLWVHDPSHTDLLESNLGRSFLYATYDHSTDTWGPPQDAWGPEINPDDYPALLPPNIALSSDDDGILAFTAVAADSPIRDTGLGSGRFVYISRLIDGVFQTPELIHGACDLIQYGEWPVVGRLYVDETLLVDQTPWFLRQPDWVMTFHGRGPLGIDSGSGDVMAVAIGLDTITAPVCLTDDADIHSNVTATVVGGMIQNVNLNGSSAIPEQEFNLGQGGGAGLTPRGYDFQSSPLLPDLSILDCRFSETFPHAGSFVTATVTVDNLGLAYSALDANKESASGVRVVYIEEDGSERMAATAELPEIPPVGQVKVALELEMPLDPVRVGAELDPNPVDSNAGNNSRECLFGAPCPREVSCEKIPLGGKEQPGVLLRWTNTGLYDEVLIYRNDLMIAALPGGCTRFVEQYCEPGDLVYAVRGRIGASKSIRVLCDVRISGPSFQRGNANADANVDLSDGVSILDWLFLGEERPSCVDAADANDSGSVDLSDAVVVFDFLFLGGPAPPAPGPFVCEVDPMEGTLDCEAFASCVTP